MNVENEHTLKEALLNGVNLFLGAGFSVGAKDSAGVNLPLGRDLLKELQEEFGVGIDDLHNYCTLLERTRRDRFYDFLLQRFTVSTFDGYYRSLSIINVKSIFTTNIDDLIPKVFNGIDNKYLNNNRVSGESVDSSAVNYLPLHGNVDAPQDGFVFGLNQLANVYNSNRRVWSFFSNAIEKYPTVFIGYNMADYSTISAMTNMRTFQSNAQKDKWIVLYQSSVQEKEFFSTLGFNIIEASTREFMEYVPKLLANQKSPLVQEYVIEKAFAANLIPKNNKNMSSRPIEMFFKGLAPSWNDILSNALYKTHYFGQIQESVYNSSVDTIVIGSPLSGKTTLAMMVGFNIQFNGPKLFFQDFTLSRAEYVAKIIGKQKALIIIDNFANDVEAFKLICSLHNVAVVGVDRSQNYGIVDHLLQEENYDIINVTELSSVDVQGVLDSLPVSIKQNDVSKQGKAYDDSIFEFVIRHIKGQSLSQRYALYMHELENEDSPLAEFLVLCAYMHLCRVPLSMEVAISYFSDEFSYQDVYDMEKQLSDQLKDNEMTTAIDMFHPRSNYLADAVMRSASADLLRCVFEGVIEKVHPLMIYNYDVFRKWAFDHELISKAFPRWQDGMRFYETAFLYDNENPFVLQHGALYLSSKRKHKEAFQWIDRAITLTHDKYFSIRNSHAIIMFEANYDVSTADAQRAMDKSMEILRNCYKTDKRRTFHAITYANQAIKYSNKYATLVAKSQLQTSIEWLEEERKSCTWKYEIVSLLDKVKEQLNVLSFV